MIIRNILLATSAMLHSPEGAGIIAPEISAEVLEAIDTIRGAFKEKHGRDTHLAKEDIVAMIELHSEEEMTLPDWVEAMIEAEGNEGADKVYPIEDIRGLVASGDIKLSATRAVFKALTKRATTLDNEGLLLAHAMTDDDDDELLVANIKVVEADRKPTSEVEKPVSAPKPKTVEATKLDPIAIAFGDKLAKDDALMAVLKQDIDTKELSKRLPASVAFLLSKDLTDEELLALPVPSSTLDDVKGKGKKSDIGKVGEPTFYGTAFDRTPEGKDILAHIEAHKLKGTADADKDIKAMSAEEARTDKAMWQSRRTDGQKALRGAVKLLLKFHAIKTTTHLRCTFRTMTKGNVTEIKRTTAPIEVYYVKPKDADGREVAVGKYMSIGSFMNVKLENVTAKATAPEQYEAFEVERKPRTGQKDNPIVIKNVDHFDEALSEMFFLFKDAKFTGDLYSRLNTGTEDSDDLLVNVMAIATEFDKLASKPAFRNRYAEVTKARAEKEKKVA